LELSCQAAQEKTVTNKTKTMRFILLFTNYAGFSGRTARGLLLSLIAGAEHQEIF